MTKRYCEHCGTVFRCPKCNSDDLAIITYDYLDFNDKRLLEQRASGEIWLGDRILLKDI
jgi:hypothetical protein